MTRMMCALAAALFFAATPAPAQTTPPAGQPPAAQAPARPRRPAAPRQTSVRISVRDDSGNPIKDARLTLSGASTGEFTTGAAGTAIVPDLKPGAYRVRAEHDGFVTLEREFTLGTGTWNPIELVMNAAPPPPAPPPPPPAPAAAPPPPSGGTPVLVAIPDYLDKELIKKEPLKESVIACEPLETVRLLQLRDAIAPHAHDRMGEIVYVVAGEGEVRFEQQTKPLRPGTMVVVPAGVRHGFTRGGKNPLILLSTLTGAPCEGSKAK